MTKRILPFLLALVILFALLPGVSAEEKGSTKAATNFVGYPSVFVTEDNYHISFLTNTNGMAWVEIGGTAYEDTTAGIMDWETKLHGITVPQRVLDSAKSYTICFRPLESRPANNPAPGDKQTKTYSFDPVLSGEDPVLLCVSDQHNNNSGAVAVSGYGAFDALVFGGDYTGHISTEAIANDFLKYCGELSKGTKPVIYPRGNHEIRGQYSHWIEGVMPASETGKSYYEFVLGDLYGIVLDCGGSYTDDYEDIADTIDFEPYRVEQTRWLEQVYAKGTWKQYSKRVIFSHTPFVTQSSFADVYKDWTNILNRMDMSLLVSGHTHSFTFYGTTHSSVKSGPNFPTFTMTAYQKDPYSYTGAYLTLGDQSFTIQQIDSASLAVKTTHTVTNKTNGITTEPVTEYVTAEAPLPAPVVSTGTASVPSVSSPFSAHPTVFIVEDNYEISFLTTETGMAWVEIDGQKYKDSTMGVMDWESRIHKVTVPQSVLNQAKKYKICFQSMSERAAYTPVHGSTVSRTYPFTPAPATPTYLCMSEQLNDNTNALKVAKYKAWDVFVCGGKYMKAANTETNRYYLLTLCGETTQGTKPTIFTRGNRELRGFGAHDVIDSMGTGSTGDTFFYFTQPNVFGIVLDTGEYAADSTAQFGDTVRFQKYREKQTQWLRQLYAEGKWKDYETRIVICHLPFTAYTDASMKAVFREWTDILDQMGVTLMISGHVNNYSYYAPGDSRNVSDPSFPMLTMSDLDNGDYAYSGTFVTFGGKSFTTENVTSTLTLRETKTVINPIYTEETELVNDYAPTNDPDVLYFGFSNTLEDQQRYSGNAVYGKTNYDISGKIQTVNFYKGSGGPYALPTGTGMGINNTEGTVYANLTGPYVKESSSSRNVTRRFVFGETDGVTASAGSLKYDPANAEVFQVRFQLHNLKVRSDIDTLDPGASGRILSLQYYKDADTSATRNGNKYGGSYVNDQYMVVTLDLDNTFRSASVITKILVEFHGFVLKDETKEGSVTLDYVYVGPRATMPTREDGYLFFGFTDSAAAQYRYASHNYGGYNFDQIANWWDNKDIASKAIVNGDLTFTSKSLAEKTWHYLGTGVGDDDSSMREYPLHHKPSADDYCEARFKLEGATPATTSGKITFTLELMPTVGSTANSVKITGYFDPASAKNGYYTLHFPMGTNASYLAMSEVVRFNLLIGSVAYGDVITASVDYLYIGTEKKMPTGHFYEETVTAPSCTEAGRAVYTCTMCGKAYEESIAPAGHTTFTDPVLDPTCTESGLTEGIHCSQCGLILTAQEEIPARGHTEAIDQSVEATCTEFGLTEGKHCSVCSAVLAAQETVPAKGHSYVYTPVDALSHGITCENCDFSAESGHAYENGVCICSEPESKEPVEDPKLKIGHTLNLAGDISMNFAVSKSVLAGFDMDTVYVESLMETYAGDGKTETTAIRLEPVDNGNYYYFTLTGLTAVQMKDRIVSTLYGTKDGQPYVSPIDHYSIADYAYSQLSKAAASDSLKALCADLLRYGTAAQIFKDYGTENLADAEMTEEQKAYLSDIEAVAFGNTNMVLEDLENAPVTWAGKSLTLDSKVCLKFVFDPKNYTGEIGDLTLKVSYEDMTGATKTVILENPELYNASRGYYAFTVDTLLAAELRTVVSVQVFSGETPVSATLQYSADTYGNNKTGTLLDLCKALFAYSDSAKRYFTP